ncbi:MAG TPA: DHH family phosphoesterase, partial [Parasegetibacter sp.]
MQKRWKIRPTPEQEAITLRKSLRISYTLCKILVQRGINTYEKARDFFRPNIDHLHSPWLMKDMDKAVQRILKAVSSKEPIMVFGDYDVDGTTSVACMYRFLKQFHTEVCFYVPDRYKEGYGVSKKGIDLAAEKGIPLIIALDCGIKSVELVAYAKKLGIDFIICDHHLPDEILPDAAAILNPKQRGCEYPYKELPGCGVGFKLISALAEKLGLPRENTWQFLDLVAISIAADIVPLTGENRVLATLGL